MRMWFCKTDLTPSFDPVVLRRRKSGLGRDGCESWRLLRVKLPRQRLGEARFRLRLAAHDPRLLERRSFVLPRCMDNSLDGTLTR